MYVPVRIVTRLLKKMVGTWTWSVKDVMYTSVGYVMVITILLNFVLSTYAKFTEVYIVLLAALII